mmetsp:Transcript_35465/g.101257  ORF Transcript_35465/g.101257 Transcript_35465/m.101257 type:complete len:344 (-) Transcript_35465:272-1303(-)
MEEASDETCGDEQALCEVLQTQVRSLERQELTQMRQGAVLQRKFDALEQQLRDARQQHQARLSNAAQRSHKRREARSSESLRCLSHAARVLEAELQTRWDEAARREQELAQRVRRGGARRVELQGDLGLWRRCGRGLLRRARPEPEPVLEDGPPQAEVEALRQGRLGLEQRLPELERITEAARQRQQQLYVQAEGLAASLCEAEAATLVARERQVSARRRESELGGAELQVPPPAEESEPTEELGRLRRRLQEQQRELTALEQEGGRLRGLLERHAGLEAQHEAGPGVPESSQGCSAFDEPVSWFAMLLFKSIFVRRGFCLHLAVLYSWLIFLLWYMSAHSKH